MLWTICRIRHAYKPRPTLGRGACLGAFVDTIKHESSMPDPSTPGSARLRSVRPERRACSARSRRISANGGSSELYRLLEPSYALYDGRRKPFKGFVCFETFPQAIACSIAGQIVSAKRKCSVRRQLLRKVGLNVSAFTNIDTVDAALCAWTAQQFSRGAAVAYGEPETGYIVVPR
jgi:Protein of unknown function (DUF429)